MKKCHTPVTRVKNSKLNIKNPDWIIWSAWTDRIIFEELKKTGETESEVIKIMRKNLKTSSFKLWKK